MLRKTYYDLWVIIKVAIQKLKTKNQLAPTTTLVICNRCSGSGTVLRCACEFYPTSQPTDFCSNPMECEHHPDQCPDCLGTGIVKLGKRTVNPYKQGSYLKIVIMVLVLLLVLILDPINDCIWKFKNWLKQRHEQKIP